MVGAMQHAKASNELFDIAASREESLVLSGGVKISRKMRQFILDYSSVGIFAITLLVQVIPRSSDAAEAASTQAANASGDGKEMQMDPRTMNMMGRMQWAIIFQFALYFCTYTMDMRAAA